MIYPIQCPGIGVVLGAAWANGLVLAMERSMAWHGVIVQRPKIILHTTASSLVFGYFTFVGPVCLYVLSWKCAFLSNVESTLYPSIAELKTRANHVTIYRLQIFPGHGRVHLGDYPPLQCGVWNRTIVTRIG